jgi:hypothetical protein
LPRHIDSDGDCDAARDFADGVQIGEERRHAVIQRRRHFAQCPRRRDENLLSDSPHSRRDQAQSDSGEDVGLVALSDLARSAPAGDRLWLSANGLPVAMIALPEVHVLVVQIVFVLVCGGHQFEFETDLSPSSQAGLLPVPPENYIQPRITILNMLNCLS